MGPGSYQAFQYEYWGEIVNGKLESDGKPYRVEDIDEPYCRKAFESGESPIVFALQRNPPLRDAYVMKTATSGMPGAAVAVGRAVTRDLRPGDDWAVWAMGVSPLMVALYVPAGWGPLFLCWFVMGVFTSWDASTLASCGIRPPPMLLGWTLVPVYLFARAARVGTGFGYAITWAASSFVGVSLLAVLEALSRIHVVYVR